MFGPSAACGMLKHACLDVPQVFRRHKHSRLEVLQLAARQNVDVWGFRTRAETSFMHVSLFFGKFEGF